MAVKRRTRIRPGRGAVLTIALLLFSSALIRMSTGTGQAVAQALAEEAADGRAGAATSTEEVAAEVTTRPDELSRTEMGELLAAIRAREERLKARETRIELRQRALDVADAEITKRLATLEEAEANLRRTLAMADSAAETDLARLTEVYETMKPKQAAALFATMEPDFAAGFIGRMRPDAAAAVIAGLPPDVAYSISVILAGRNAKAPKS